MKGHTTKRIGIIVSVKVEVLQNERQESRIITVIVGDLT